MCTGGMKPVERMDPSSLNQPPRLQANVESRSFAVRVDKIRSESRQKRSHPHNGPGSDRITRKLNYPDSEASKPLHIFSTRGQNDCEGTGTAFRQFFGQHPRHLLTSSETAPAQTIDNPSGVAPRLHWDHSFPGRAGFDSFFRSLTRRIRRWLFFMTVKEKTP